LEHGDLGKRTSVTLLTTEIHPINGLDDTLIVFAADRRISKITGGYLTTRKKIFRIDYLTGGIGYFGLAEVPNLPMSDWLARFIRANANVRTLREFGETLARELNRIVPRKWRQQQPSGFHLAGHNVDGLPEFWYVRNLDDDRTTLFGEFRVREDFLARDAPVLGFDGQNPLSVSNDRVQIYRNGDIRAHVAVWESLDGSFGQLLRLEDFRRLARPDDYEGWVKFKMELVAYFYKHYAKQAVIGRPIDVFSIRGGAARRSLRRKV
jgi:hypothetical protein